MKKSYRRLIIVIAAIVMMMSMGISAFADDTDLAITNNTSMFKAVSAKLSTDGGSAKLVVALSGSGYHELFKGTYEEAVKNGDKTDNWIHGYENSEGKWEFQIPLEKDETYIPVVAISNSYYEKYLKGENGIERAFFPRQFTVDAEAKTLVTGDFDHTYEVALTNNVKMFKPASAASVRVVGGPNSNNYAITMTLPMESDSMDQVRAASYSNQGGTFVEGDPVTIDFVKYDEADGNNVGEFKDIPVQDDEMIVIEFHSKSNGNWYKRDFTLDLEEKKAVFDPHKADLDDFEGLTEEEAVALAKSDASVKLLNQLIEAIQVQVRDNNTDKYCAAAKACWDALSDEDKKEDDGYFSDDTGDASADDPLNQDEIGEKELLVVSFGTSFNDSRAKDIGGVEKALAAAYPGWSVRRAFTAQIIINHIQAREGIKIDNMEQALDRAVASKVKTLVIQPTHLMRGQEYDELVLALNSYKDKFDSVKVAEPLLGKVGAETSTINADKEAAAKAAVAEAVRVSGFSSLDDAEKAGVAFVFMGHGTSHDASITYDQMQAQMKALGYKNVFIGTVEGIPEDTALPAVKKAVEDAGYKKVILRPLMVVAGDHANNDMAADEEGTWYYGFVNGGEFEVEGADKPVDIGKGFGADNVTCQIEGLGRIADIQKIYVAHTADATSEAPVVEKKANTMTVKAKTIKAKAAKKMTFKKAKAFTVKKAVGKVTFKKTNGSKKITVNKNGKVTVKKGLKKGKTYKVKVKVTAAGNSAYKSKSKTVTLTVKVK